MSTNNSQLNIQELTSGIASDEFFEIINDNFTELKKSSQYSDLSSNDIQDGAITTEKIANNAVTTDKIQDNAITENKIANNAITNEKIVDETITKNKLSSDLQATLDSTKRIFVVSSLPTGTTITVGDTTYDIMANDIFIKVSGLNG